MDSTTCHVVFASALAGIVNRTELGAQHLQMFGISDMLGAPRSLLASATGGHHAKKRQTIFNQGSFTNNPHPRGKANLSQQPGTLAKNSLVTQGVATF